MGSSISNPLVLWALLAIVTAASLAWSVGQRQGLSRSRWWFVLMASPGLIMSAAYYSLALHMRWRMGGWPDFYGTALLPDELLWHVELAYMTFSGAILLVLGVPLLLLVFALVPRLRSHLVYPASCGVVCWCCLFLTALAPSGFQQWWWD